MTLFSSDEEKKETIISNLFNDQRQVIFEQRKKIILDKEGHEISRILGSIDFLDKQFLEWLKSIVNS